MITMERMVRIVVIVALVFILANVMAPWVISRMVQIGLLESPNSESHDVESTGS